MKMAYSVATTLSPSQFLRGFSVCCANSRTLVPHWCLIITNFVPRVSEFGDPRWRQLPETLGTRLLYHCVLFIAHGKYSAAAAPRNFVKRSETRKLKCHL